MIASIQHTPRKPSILAIEPDPDRAYALTQLVHDYIDAKVVVSATADVAVAVIAKQIPDLILMSAFTPPNEERTLIEFLRQTTEVNVPMLMVWPIFERRAEKTSVSSSLYRVLRRTPEVAPVPMRDAIGAGMRLALETAREGHGGTANGAADGSNGRPGSVHQAVCVPRAPRWTPRDLSWLTGVRLASGDVRQLVNISNSGLLVECDSVLMPGTAVTFQLCANGTELWHPNTDLMVPARIVRSEVSKVDTDHLRYLVAARFQRELALPSKTPIPQEASEVPLASSDQTVAGSGVDEIALRAGERLQELARALESFESAVGASVPRHAASAAHRDPSTSH